MRLIAWLLTEILRKTGGIQAFLIRHISPAKVSNKVIFKIDLDFVAISSISLSFEKITL